MWEPFRKNLIAEHRFYIEQARKRLLSQFENIGAEADRAAEEHLAKMSVRFNPNIHDGSEFYETAHDKVIEFYQLLSDMHETTRLSVIAGMFHQWDKKLRDWIVREMHHWHHGENAARSIWKAEVPEIMRLLVAFGFNVKSLPSYERLDAMRLVVNVFKHGNGRSFDELKESFPEFISNPLGGDGDCQFLFHYLDHTDMKVTDAHLDQFSEAILDFWKDVPKEIFLSEELNTPKWFEKEFQKDLG
ncbi:hypothetical protein [Ferrovum myxofaciens]|uniref:hypothetical protein n=1 Tax=Ferrovum myxofaciens TaxID=416213 RepID=UPI0004E17F3B|nr:hypothetical protein [Ferrovum myxofaciens]